MKLSKEQIKFYNENGYLIIRNFLDGNTLKKLQKETDHLHEKMAKFCNDLDKSTKQITCLGKNHDVAWEQNLENSPPKIRQLMGSEKSSPIIEQILISDNMLDIIEQLIGPEIILYHSKLMMKPAKDGSFTPWHQDWGYWSKASIEPTQINAMLSIDDATIENGCIRHVKGSHLKGYIEHKDFNTPGFSIGLEGNIEDYDADIIESKAGDLVLHGALTIHASAPNTSHTQRRANTYAFDKTRNFKNKETKERVLRSSQHVITI